MIIDSIPTGCNGFRIDSKFCWFSRVLFDTISFFGDSFFGDSFFGDTFDQVLKPLDPTGLNYSKAEPTKITSDWISENDSNVVKVSVNSTDRKVNNESGNTLVEVEENNNQVFNIEADNMSRTTEPVSAHFGNIAQNDNQIPPQQREHLLSLDQPHDRNKNISFTVGDDYKTAKSGSNNDMSLVNVKQNKSDRNIDDGF